MVQDLRGTRPGPDRRLSLRETHRVRSIPFPQGTESGEGLTASLLLFAHRRFRFRRRSARGGRGCGRAVPLSATFHAGVMNLVMTDGHVDALSLKDITRTSPKDFAIWTRQSD